MKIFVVNAFNFNKEYSFDVDRNLTNKFQKKEKKSKTEGQKNRNYIRSHNLIERNRC